VRRVPREADRRDGRLAARPRRRVPAGSRGVGRWSPARSGQVLHELTDDRRTEVTVALGVGVRRNTAAVDPAERALPRDALIAADDRVFPGGRAGPTPGDVSWRSKRPNSTRRPIDREASAPHGATPFQHF
jgi:hypothetical protein